MKQKQKVKFKLRKKNILAKGDDFAVIDKKPFEAHGNKVIHLNREILASSVYVWKYRNVQKRQRRAYVRRGELPDEVRCNKTRNKTKKVILLSYLVLSSNKASTSLAGALITPWHITHAYWELGPIPKNFLNTE